MFPNGTKRIVRTGCSLIPVIALLSIVGIIYVRVTSMSYGAANRHRSLRRMATVRGNVATQYTAGPMGIGKHVVSDKLRLHFVVGLEGSGHHYFLWAIDALFSKSYRMKRIDTCRLAQHTNLMLRPALQNPSEYADAIGQIRQEMERLAKIESTLEEPGVVVPVTSNRRGTPSSCHGSSYPSGWGPDKALQYVDVVPLAVEAEKAGVDFRVVYLARSARDIVVANTQHRNFTRNRAYSQQKEKLFMYYMDILMTDAGVVHSLLSEIGPEFVVCHHYDKLGDTEQARDIANFLSPTEASAEVVTTALIDAVKARSVSTEELLFVDEEEVIQRLQDKLDIIEATFCHS